MRENENEWLFWWDFGWIGVTIHGMGQAMWEVTRFLESLRTPEELFIESVFRGLKY
jgi:hypothetical protein